ncbi:mucin-binding protein [Lactiplantibacillus plajomi]|uniref:MucBP domain-containing protein n=1 Tax=Lactiplantibacillus plajomi TaxID=1457217 RepID=A0ABV6K4M8_9LACO|nr:MucBP domain-containing protein [Lactiplantibacillus plajomi]
MGKQWFGEAKTHFKMHKRGKQWVVLGITLFSVGLGLQGLPQHAAAATITAKVPATVVSGEQTENSAAPASQSTASAGDDQSAASEGMDQSGAASEDAQAGTADSATANSAVEPKSTPSPVKDAPATESEAPTVEAAQSEQPRAKAKQQATTTTLHTKSAAKAASSKAALATSAVQSAAKQQSTPATTNGKVRVTKDNFEDYFQVNGNGASYNRRTGTVTLTPDEKSHSGNVTLKTKINMNQSFSLNGSINLGTKSQGHGGADGVSFGFHNDETSKVGLDGGAAGLGKLNGAFGWKADTYWDEENRGQYIGSDPEAFGYHKGFLGFISRGQGQGKAYGSFIHTDNQGIVYTDAKTAQGISEPSRDQWRSIQVDYDGQTKQMTINYDNHQWTADVSQWINNDALAFFIAAATGENSNLQQFQINSFDYYQAATVNVKYVDQNGQELTTGDVTYPDGKFAGKTYQTSQLTIPHYTFQGLADGSIATSGTLANWGENGTVTYVYALANEGATVNYVDQTTGKTITTDAISGQYDSQSEYTTANQIAKLTAKGYQLVQDGFPAGYVFGSQTEPVFTVTLKHGQETATETKTLQRTIQYVYENGHSAAKSVTQPLSFTRTNTRDQVTGDVQHGAWTADQTNQYAAVHSPVITGYRADQLQVAAETPDPNGATDQKVTVTYSPLNETARVDYVDDVTAQTVTNDEFSGVFNRHVDNPTATTIDQLAEKGYQVVSSDFPADGVDITWTTPKVFTVHLTHAQKPQSATKVISQTIDYVYEDGRTAFDSAVQHRTFERTLTIDQVTGKTVAASDWVVSTPAGDDADGNQPATATKTTFDAVTSPELTGYHPTIDQIAEQIVTAGDEDHHETVTYKANTEYATVTYRDVTTGKNLKVENLSGDYGTKDDYRTADAIKDYEANGYVLVNSEFPAAGISYDQTQGQKYTVNLTHGTTDRTENQTVKRTITYVYRNGATAQPDVNQQLAFTRTVTTDNVTGTETPTAWKAINGSAFAQVDTPTITGYTADLLGVAAKTVSADDQDVSVKVTYNPNVEYATVTYQDVMTGDILDQASLSGDFGTKDAYDPKTAIAAYEAAGYQLVDSDFPTAGISYDQTKQQDYTVRLTHAQVTVPGHHVVTRTINYVYADGQTAQPSVKQAVNFTRDETTDQVTHVMTPTDWVADDGTTLAEVATPAITGYTPDTTLVAAQPVTADTADNVVTVTYQVDDEKATVTYVDDTTGKTLTTVELNGDFGTADAYDPKATIADYEANGYDFEKSDFPEAGIRYDQTQDQKYTVYLTHGTTDRTENQTVKRTITYVYQNGTSAQPDVNQQLAFTRTVTTDNVTGTETPTDWQPVNGATFAQVETPTITGYTTEQPVVAAKPVTANDENSLVKVTYNPIDEQATVTYVDDTTGKTLTTVKLNGDFGTKDAYSPKDTITDYEANGYQLVDSDFPAAGISYDQTEPQTYTVHLKHAQATVPGHHAVTRTINYVYTDGQTAQPSVKQTISFTRDETTDQVTHVMTPTDWVADDGTTLAEVATPTIKGYTPDTTLVKAQTVTADTADNVETVTYQVDNEKATVTYVDDTTGKTLTTVKLNGDFGTKDVYSPKAAITDYEAAGYQLVDSDFPAAGIHYDQTEPQTYTAHLKHAQVTVAGHHTVTRTINYVYADGQTAQPSVKQTVNFTRDETTDQVTGDVTTTDWVADDVTTLAEVATPAIKGYTPDTALVKAQTVTAETTDSVETVTYGVNTEHATVTYKDDTTGETLAVKQLNGDYLTTSDYRTAQDIATWVAKGYELEQDETPTDGITFDQDGVTPNYDVTLTHKLSKSFDRQPVTRTIHYHFTDGRQALADVVDQLPIGRSSVTDMVTNEVTKGAWTAIGKDEFDALKNPSVTGYHSLNGDEVPAMGLPADLQDTVIEISYAPNAETATVTYVDDTTGATLDQVSLTGDYGTSDAYRTTDALASYNAAGYELVSSDFPATGISYDQTEPQTYTVHLKHGQVTVAGHHTVTRTINYVYTDGQTAQPSVKQIVNFTRDETTDQVTGDVTASEWVAADVTEFAEVATPAMDGFDADLARVAAMDVAATTVDGTVTVTYHQVQPTETKTDERSQAGTTQTGHADQPTTPVVPTSQQTGTKQHQSAAVTPATASVTTRTQRATSKDAATTGQLPQTDEQASDASALGLAALALTSVLSGLITLKKH